MNQFDLKYCPMFLMMLTNLSIVSNDQFGQNYTSDSLLDSAYSLCFCSEDNRIDPYKDEYSSLLPFFDKNEDSELFERYDDFIDSSIIFAKKYINELKPIDGEIRKVISDSFWEML